MPGILFEIQIGIMVAEMLTKRISEAFQLLDPASRVMLMQTTSYLATEALHLAATTDPDEQTRIKANIAHAKNTLASIEGLKEINTYNLTVEIVGDVISLALKALI